MFILILEDRIFGWAGHLARMEEGRSAFNILSGKSKGNRLLGRPRRRWEDNIRMDHKGIGINARNAVKYLALNKISIDFSHVLNTNGKIEF